MAADNSNKQATKRTKGSTVAKSGRVRGGRPSREQSAAITARILDDAAHLFLADGFEATAMEAVAKRAGVPKTTLYKRYADKVELLRAVISSRTRQWSLVSTRRALPDTEDLRSHLVHYVSTLLVWSRNKEVRSMATLSAKLPESKGLGAMAINLEGYRDMTAIIARAIRTLGPSSGIVASDPERAATLLMTLVIGAWAMPADRALDTFEEATEVASELVDFAMGDAATW